LDAFLCIETVPEHKLPPTSTFRFQVVDEGEDLILGSNVVDLTKHDSDP
jgi:hypothetical protein